MPPSFALKLGSHLDTPEQKRIYNRALFTEVAPRYDLVTRLLSLGRDSRWKRSLLAALPDRNAPICVDLACGTGDITRLLKQRYPDATVIGTDLTPSMLQAAASKTQDASVQYQEADMCSTGFDTDSIDVVTGSYALRNAPSLESALREVHRILKPNGIAGFLDFSKPASPFLQKMEYGLLKGWGSLWGLFLHRNPEVYAYIAESLAQFPDRVALTMMLEANGFCIQQRKTHFFGIMERLIIVKSAD